MKLYEVKYGQVKDYEQRTVIAEKPDGEVISVVYANDKADADTTKDMLKKRHPGANVEVYIGHVSASTVGKRRKQKSPKEFKIDPGADR